MALTRTTPYAAAFILLTATWSVAQPTLRLSYSIGLADGAIDSDGVTFTVEVCEAGQPQRVLADDRHTTNEWLERSVDLSAFQGKEILIRFSTSPGATTTYDWACWGEPKILHGDDVVHDLTAARIWRSGIRLDDGTELPMDSNATGAGFRLGERNCGGVRQKGFMAHPPWKGEHVGAAAFAEFRLTPDRPPALASERPSLPQGLAADSSPFPAGTAPCFRTDSPIIIDGNLDDWPTAIRSACLTVRTREQLSVDSVSHKPGWKAGWNGPGDFSSTFFLAWDDSALYLAEVRRDDVLCCMDTMSQDFMSSDALRICLSRSGAGDRLAEGDYVLAILPEGEQDQPMLRLCDYGAYRHEDFPLDELEIAPKLLAGGWILEVKLPFAAFGVQPKPGTTLGFQLILTDSDTPMDRHYEMTWKPKTTDNYWRQPSAFGALTLCRDSFAWLDLARRVFALNEKPVLHPGLFSLSGARQARLDMNVRTPQGTIQPFSDATQAQAGTPLVCDAFGAAGLHELTYRLTMGADEVRGRMAVDVAGDRTSRDLSLLVQPAKPTPCPSVATAAYTNRVTRGAERVVLEYADGDGTLRYLYTPGLGFDVEIELDGETVFRSDPKTAGPQLLSSRDAMPQPDAIEVGERTLAYQCTAEDGLDIRYRVSIQGKSLIIDVESDQGRFSEVRGPLHGLQAQRVFIPYLDHRMAVFRTDDVFFSSYCDWTVTNASHLQGLGSSVYRAKTDGTRNPLRERIYMTVSRELLEVLPNLPNPPSPFIEVLAPKMVLDCWGWGSRYTDLARYLEVIKGYGVDELAIIYHVWQCHGYDNGLPQHVPANAGRGGDADMRELGAVTKRLGYLFSLHENYIDYYPNFPDYTEDAVALDSNGRKINAWYMPSTGIQSYRLKPSWIERYVRDQSSQVHERYSTSAAYLDVHSVALPFQIDFDARSEGAASLRYSFEKLTWLFNFMRETHRGPLFGEGNLHSVWAGRIDGCEAQIGGRGGEIRPVLVDFDLLKVHPLTVNHGMGYYSRWHRSKHGRLTDEEHDKYRAQELAYGHAGFANSGAMANLTQFLREHYLLNPLQSRYVPDRPAQIAYLFDGPADDPHWVSARIACRTDAPRKVYVRYQNGLRLWINDHSDGWAVEGHVLPPYGFVAIGSDVRAATARRNVGLIGDYVETPDRIFADPRTYQAFYTETHNVVDVRPQAPTLIPLTGRKYSMTYRWDVHEGLDKDYIAFVHFTDADGRILWQNDHRPAVPTSRWTPETAVEDGPHGVEVPAHIPDGTYDVRVGMFIPKMGRLAINGHDAGGNSYLLARLEFGHTADGQTRLRLLPKPDLPPALREGRNPAGSMVDFGTLATDVTVKIDRTDNALLIMPIPHGHAGRLTLRLEQLLPPTPINQVQVIALDTAKEPLQPVRVTREGGEVSFEMSQAEAWTYQVQVR